MPGHCSKSLLLWLKPAVCVLVFLSVLLDASSGFNAVLFQAGHQALPKRKIHQISLGAVVKRGELQPVRPEEAHPQLGALLMVIERKEKAEAVLQPLFFFTAGNTHAMRRDYWWVEWQLHLSLAFILCPNKSAVGLLWGIGFCLLPPLICCSLQSRQLSTWKVQWRRLHFVAHITWKLVKCHS